MINIREERRIQREIIRRALESARMGQEERERLRDRRDTLEVLREMTGLTSLELEHIADGVVASRKSTDAGFFSVKNQIIYTGVMVSAVLGIPIMMIWLI